METTHLYLKMLESHCLVYGDKLKVQKKRKRRRPRAKPRNNAVEEETEPKGPEGLGPEGLTESEKRHRLEEAWQNLVDELSSLLNNVRKDSDVLPKDVVPFDSVADHGFDEK